MVAFNEYERINRNSNLSVEKNWTLAGSAGRLGLFFADSWVLGLKDNPHCAAFPALAPLAGTMLRERQAQEEAAADAEGQGGDEAAEAKGDDWCPANPVDTTCFSTNCRRLQ